MNPQEQTWQASDGTALFVRAWHVPQPRGVFCIHHGLGEHGGRYQPLADFLNAHQYSVVAPDARGHGRSGGAPCFAPSYQQLYQDWQLALDHSRRWAGEGRLFAIGHSWGGGFLASWLLRQDRDDRIPVDAVVLSAPLFLPADPPPRWKVLLGRIFSRLTPRTLLTTEVDPAKLSSDPQVAAAFLADPLCRAAVSARLGSMMLDEGEWLLSDRASQRTLDTPLLVMHGDADGVTSPSASEQFVDRIGPPAQLQRWPGARHELFLEANRDEVYETLLRWVESQV